jgi:hypothetical protein
LASPVIFGNRHIVLERDAASRLPVIYQFPEAAPDGGCFVTARASSKSLDS